MKIEDMICNHVYRGRISNRVGRYRERKLLLIEWHTAIAHFRELSEPFTKAGRPPGTEFKTTLKSFVRWAIKEVD